MIWWHSLTATNQRLNLSLILVFFVLKSNHIATLLPPPIGNILFSLCGMLLSQKIYPVLKMEQSFLICILVFHVVSLSGIGRKGSYVKKLITKKRAYCVSRCGAYPSFGVIVNFRIFLPFASTAACSSGNDDSDE